MDKVNVNEEIKIYDKELIKNIKMLKIFNYNLIWNGVMIFMLLMKLIMI